MTRFNYIVTVHNKEDLIERVLGAILVCAGENSHIYPVLDGCTDGTEAVIDELMRRCDGLPITKLYAPNVHEIRSLNIALSQVPQEGEGYNILLQDDIILGDRNFESKVEAVHEHFEHKVGVVSFRHGVNVQLLNEAGEIAESDIVESCFGQGMAAVPLLPGEAAVRMVVLRSPECISCRTVREIGILDERYAPYTYDDHDYSMRCLRAGLSNLVYAVKVVSRVEWGGMRRKPQPGAAAIMKRNRRYVYKDHAEFIRSLPREKFLAAPIRVPVVGPREDDATALEIYENSRRLLAGFLRKDRFSLRRLRERFARRAT